MAAPKGTMPPNAGKGRKKGQINKATADVRKTIALIAERKVLEVEKWLNRVGRKSPDKALELYLKMIEYHIPKLTRSEHTGADGAPLAPPVFNFGFANGGPGHTAGTGTEGP